VGYEQGRMSVTGSSSTAHRFSSSSAPAFWPVALVWLASVIVLVLCTLTSFRLGFAEDLRTALLVNGPRVLFGAGVGALLALAGCVRLAAHLERPLRELEILALSTGAAGGGFVLAQGRGGLAALVLFSLGAVIGATLLLALVRGLDRPRRWTNIALALALAAMAAIGALVGTYVRERRDPISPAVTWLLGDLGGASFASGLILCAVVLVLVSRRGLSASTGMPPSSIAWIAQGVAIGAAGPLAFVGALAPRTVRWLAQGASERALLPASAVAGAATVVAIDSVPRLLLGGYDFPWNVPAAMLAIPIFLGWNRMRLRREAGASSLVFEIFEALLLIGMTIGGAVLASVLVNVIRAAT
jgi:ABC-type Fe3+-siderophore transport system permease subunit